MAFLNNNITECEKHPFHLVDPSPWPLLTSLITFKITIGFVKWFQAYQLGLFKLIVAIIVTIIFMLFWFKDIVNEGTFEGQHTSKVQLGLRMGVALFIVSEVMFVIFLKKKKKLKHFLINSC